MKLKVETNNLSQAPVQNAFLFKVIKETLAFNDFRYLNEKNIVVSVALISSQEIKRLNKTYRKKNSITDVLSFAEYKSEKELKQIGDKNIFLGEIILCYNDIEKYAQEKSKSVKQEVAKVISHGLLHLLGFQHSKKMFQLQDAVAENYNQ